MELTQGEEKVIGMTPVLAQQVGGVLYPSLDRKCKRSRL